MSRQLTGPDCVAWVARTVEQYTLSGEQRLEDAVWKLDQVLGAYAHVRDGLTVFGLRIPEPILAEVATPCEVLIEQAIDDCRVAMVRQFGQMGIETFFRRGRYFGLKLDGDPGPAPVRLEADTALRHAMQQLIKRLRDTKVASAYWLDAAYDPYDIPPDHCVACVVRRPRGDLDALVAVLVDRGVRVPEAIIAVYRECDGISIGWVTERAEGPLLDELRIEDELIRPFEDVFGMLDEHSHEDIQIGNRGSGWFYNRNTGVVFDRDSIHVRPSLLAHIEELTETYGLYQRVELTSS